MEALSSSTTSAAAATVEELPSQRESPYATQLSQLGITLASFPKEPLIYISSFFSNVDIQSFKTVSKEFRSANSATQLTFKPDTPYLASKITNYKTPNMIKKINLDGCNVTNVDFRRFPHLEEINLRKAQNLTPNQFNQLPTTLKKITLYRCNVAECYFSRFTQLEEFLLGSA